MPGARSSRPSASTKAYCEQNKRRRDRIGRDAFVVSEKRLSRAARSRHIEHGVDRIGVVGFAQLSRDLRIAQQTGDARQRLEMIGAGRFGREQKKNQIDRLTIERFKIDRPFEPREQSKQTSELRQLAVRNGDAVADAGRAELLALQKDFQNRTFALTRELGRARGEFLDRFFLPLTLSAGMIAVGATRSESVMDLSNNRKWQRGLVKGC